MHIKKVLFSIFMLILFAGLILVIPLELTSSKWAVAKINLLGIDGFSTVVDNLRKKSSNSDVQNEILSVCYITVFNDKAKFGDMISSSNSEKSDLFFDNLDIAYDGYLSWGHNDQITKNNFRELLKYLRDRKINN